MKLVVKLFDELTLTELYEILKARSQIFIMEQNIHYLDMDDVDYKSIHFFYKEDHKVIAYLRAYYIDNKTIKIGRVLTLKHGQGLGKRLVEESVEVIKKKVVCEKINMDAQKYAVGFYEKCGFKVCSDEFLEEGIVHVQMEMQVDKC